MSVMAKWACRWACVIAMALWSVETRDGGAATASTTHGHAAAVAVWAAWGQAGGAGQLAQQLVEKAGAARGVCQVLGAADGDLALHLAASGRFKVHLREPSAAAAAQLRRQADDDGLSVQQIVVEDGSLRQLPLADNLADIVLATQVDADLLGQLSAGELLRVLRPGGAAIIGQRNGGRTPALTADHLRRWAKSANVADAQVWQDSSGLWLKLVKPIPAGIDAWSHWQHGPDNNPYSRDAIIKAPYLTQYLTRPYYIAMPSITTAAGGRTFLAMGHIAHHKREEPWLNTLVARNGYNGTILWKRKLPAGYLVHRSAFIATPDVFYMIDGDHCLMLDPQTGAEKGQIRIAGLSGQWHWMAMLDGVLYVLAGGQKSEAELTAKARLHTHWSWADLSRGYYRKPRVPWGFGDTLAAYDIQRGRLLWTHREDSLIDSRAMAVGGGRLFLYCPDKHLRALAAETGKPAWTNADRKVIELIEQPGRGLISTPGFRSECMAVYADKALVIQGQTRMNVVAVSTADGHLLWTRRKVTNNPNALYVDGRVILGVGTGGSHLAIDVASGEVLADLRFRKRSCTRLTGCSDSFFVRGEGLLRFDRRTRRSLVDGAARPACNDGAIPANGLLYVGPWLCDCNLTLMGGLALCSAGDFQFRRRATNTERLQSFAGNGQNLAPLPTTDADWPTYRGNNRRTAGTDVPVSPTVSLLWQYRPGRTYTPTPPVAAAGLVLLAGQDGKLRALDAETGKLRWQALTTGPVLMPPTIADGRAYVGSGDGYVYAFEAATGRPLWRFRAAPVERRIPVYGALASTWPVNSGVLVHEGIAYAAAGIVDRDGTHVYALEATSGKLRWQNNASGHLNPRLRKGVSVQGDLTIAGNQLLLAGGNQVSPAAYDLTSGRCLSPRPVDGMPRANRGQEVCRFGDRYILFGGRLLYSAVESVVSPAYFSVRGPAGQFRFCDGRTAPAWNQKLFAFVHGRFGPITCCDPAAVTQTIDQARQLRAKLGRRRARLFAIAAALRGDRARWVAKQPDGAETLSLAVAANAVLAVRQLPGNEQSRARWTVTALAAEDGQTLWEQPLPSRPLPGGLAVGRDGHLIVALQNGGLLCYGEGR